IYVHFDVDVLDPADAPAMNYPAAGGPTVDVVRAVFKRLAASGQIVAVSVSAWNPDMAGSDRTQEIVLNLLAELIA
ncbi:MAG: arginase family protein, partial [Anaerolineales bacterium]|nr:arginase family protein [Anaerolineales bacterium]